MAPGSTAADINLIDVWAEGDKGCSWLSPSARPSCFDIEFAEPDDSKLSDYKQLVQPANAAKAALLNLGLP